MYEEKEEKIEKVEWGCVTKIYTTSGRVYLIYGPPFTETAQRVRERLESEGFSVVMLNEGVDSDAEISKKLVLQALQQLDC